LEQKWLREQNELVKLVKEREIKRKELQEKKQELTVLNTKKLRIESELDVRFLVGSKSNGAHRPPRLYFLCVILS
jgi:hypothetical protein